MSPLRGRHVQGDREGLTGTKGDGFVILTFYGTTLPMMVSTVKIYGTDPMSWSSIYKFVDTADSTHSSHMISTVLIGEYLHALSYPVEIIESPAGCVVNPSDDQDDGLCGTYEGQS